MQLDFFQIMRKKHKNRNSQQTAIENAKALLADGKYTAQEISKLLNIPVEYFAN